MTIFRIKVRGRTIGAALVFLLIASGAASNAADQTSFQSQPFGKGIETKGYLWNSRYVEALELEGDLASGAQIFQASCTECHDAGGAGKKSGLVPKIAGQHFTVVVKQIDDFLNGDRDGTVSFLALSSALKTPQDLADIAEYVAAMPRKLETGVGPGIKLDLGKELYEKDCRSCHRDDGRGRADGAFPIIAGQHFGYLYSQIRDMALKRRRNSLPAMVDVISEYSPEELMAVTDYLSRLEWPETQETEYE